MATNIRSPYKLIKFDSINHQLEKPTLLLKTRGGKYLGKIDYDNLNFSFVAQGLDEISFDVHKSKNGQGTIKNTNVTESLWDKLRDLCIIDYVGYNWFYNTKSVSNTKHKDIRKIDIYETYLKAAEIYFNYENKLKIEYFNKRDEIDVTKIDFKLNF